MAGDGLNLSESGVAAYRLFVQPGGNVGIGIDTPSQRLDVRGTLGSGTTAAGALDVRGNVPLGADGNNKAIGTGQVIEFVGPGFNTDPVGLYRVNTAANASKNCAGW